MPLKRFFPQDSFLFIELLLGLVCVCVYFMYWCTSTQHFVVGVSASTMFFVVNIRNMYNVYQRRANRITKHGTKVYYLDISALCTHTSNKHMEKLIDGYINGLTNDFSHLGVSRSEMNEILRQLKIIFSSRKINGHNRHCDNEIFVYWSGYWIDCDLLHELHHVVQLYKTGKDDVTHKDSMWWNNMTNSTLV